MHAKKNSWDLTTRPEQSGDKWRSAKWNTSRHVNEQGTTGLSDGVWTTGMWRGIMF